jgi:uncharacterized surface protein with fasciclin (FAS1) repeats
MRTTRTVSAVAAVAALAAGSVLTTAPAQAKAGTTPLTEVLAADGNKYDRNWDDFDIVEKAVRAVLKADPDSSVAVLADGDTALTAFVPTDRAFRKLVTSVTGDRPAGEKATFAAVASLGVDTVEDVLLYHVVPGATVTYAAAKKSDGARLETALGKHIGVRAAGGEVRLVDADRDARNARVIPAAKNVNKGNDQIAHGIDRVLRPMDL